MIERLKTATTFPRTFSKKLPRKGNQYCILYVYCTNPSFIVLFAPKTDLLENGLHFYFKLLKRTLCEKFDCLVNKLDCTQSIVLYS